MRGLVAYRLRADLRRRWRAVLGLTLLAAFLGGIVLGSVAGARRTGSAYPRLLDVVDPPELLVSPPGDPTLDPTPFYEDVADLPGVRDAGLIAGLPLVPEAGTPSERLLDSLEGIGVVAAVDSRWGFDIGRPRIVAGRLPDPATADEVLVSERFAAREDLQVGDRIDGVLLTEAETGILAPAEPSRGQPVSLTVTGVGVLYDEVVPFGDLNEFGSILATGPLAAMVERSNWNFEGTFVDAEPGADLDELAAAIGALGRDESLGTGGPVFISDQSAAARRVGDAIRPLAVSVAVAAAAFALVSLLVVGQAVSRSSRERPDDIEALRAIGSRPADRLVVALGRAAVVGIGGAIGAVLVAVAVSGRFPIGVARTAEPDPGIRIDGAVLSVGALTIVALTVLSSLPGALLGLRRRAEHPKLSRLAGAAAAAGLSPAAVQAVRFAVVGGARTIPMRSTLAAVTVAIASVFATVVFADSLVGLIDTPRRYGQGWDRMIDAQFGPVPVPRILDRIGSSDEVEGIALGNYGDVVVNGVAVAGFDLDSVRGDVSVRIVEGRPAADDNEIVLGGETLERVEADVGDTVAVDVGDGPHSMRVTGRGVFPHMGLGSFTTAGLGVGAQLPAGSIRSFTGIDPDELPPDVLLDGRSYNFVAIDVAGAPDSLDAELIEIEESVAADDGFAFVRTEQPPTKIRDLDRVRVVPAATAAALALVAVVALAHLLVTSVRERRREFALLRTLGFSRRQLHAAVSWHASVIVVIALVIGTPLGVAMGRVTWRWFADGIHAFAPAETPWVALAAALAGTLAFANVIAAVPGRWAARTHPASTLREE